MKILTIFLNDEVRTGGHRRYLELVHELSSCGHDILFIHNDKLSFSFDSVSIYPVALDEQIFFNNRSLRFRKAVKKIYQSNQSIFENVDWIIIFGETNLISAAYLKNKINNCKLLFAYRSDVIVSYEKQWRAEKEFHNFLTYKLNTIKYNFYGRLVGKNAEKIVFQSNYDKQNWESRHPEFKEKTAVIGGNIGLPWYQKKFQGINKSTSLRRLLFIGGLNPRKGLIYLLEALNEIKDECPELHLTVVGFGDDLEKYKAYVNQHNMAQMVDFMGRINNPFPLYESHDLLIVPSLFDSYPNTVLEAIHTGCLVIGSATGGITDMLKNDIFLFPPGNSRILADRILHFYFDDFDFQTQRTILADKLSLFHFNWAEKFSNLLKEERTS